MFYTALLHCAKGQAFSRNFPEEQRSLIIYQRPASIIRGNSFFSFWHELVILALKNAFGLHIDWNALLLKLGCSLLLNCCKWWKVILTFTRVEYKWLEKFETFHILFMSFILYIAEWGIFCLRCENRGRNAIYFVIICAA